MNILVPLWGKKYIDYFFEFTIIGLLHKHNLPKINLETRITFLTNSLGKKQILRNKSLASIEKFAEINFLEIDDIITDFNYTVILTLAYARGLMRTPSTEYFKTLFVMLNADFYLSDGSLKRIEESANSGYSAIFGTSLRVNDKVFTKTVFKSAKNIDQIIINNRKLVSLSLQNLHPTVNTMDLSSPDISSRAYSKIYKKINNDLMLSHDFIYCCMGIVPMKILYEINSYVDYSFVPDLCDLDRMTFLNDSDNYFCMELHDPSKELELMEFKRKSEAEIANRLSNWTTVEHRIYADQTVIFHTNNLSENDFNQIAKFNKEFQSIKEKMKKPINYKNHKYWISGVQAWRYHMQLKGYSEEQINLIAPEVRARKGFKISSILQILSSKALLANMSLKKYLGFTKKGIPKFISPYIEFSKIHPINGFRVSKQTKSRLLDTNQFRDNKKSQTQFGKSLVQRESLFRFVNLDQNSRTFLENYLKATVASGSSLKLDLVYWDNAILRRILSFYSHFFIKKHYRRKLLDLIIYLFFITTYIIVCSPLIKLFGNRFHQSDSLEHSILVDVQSHD